MDPGGQGTGRTYVAVSMGPPNMPPPLSTISSTTTVSAVAGAASGTTTPVMTVGGGGGTIVMKPSHQQQQQQPTPQQTAVLQRKLSTNDQLTVLTVRNTTAPTIITISNPAPPLASFSNSRIRFPLPASSSALASRLSIDQRDGTVFVNRTINSPANQLPTARVDRDGQIVLLPKTPAPVVTTTTAATASAVSTPRVNIMTQRDGSSAGPPVQEIVIGHRNDFMYTTALSFDDLQEQQRNLRHTIHSKVSHGYAVQFGSSDIMSSNQPTKIGHTTIVKQNLSPTPTPHIIPVGASTQLANNNNIGGTSQTTTTTAVLLPIQQSSVPAHLQQHIISNDYKRLTTPTNATLKVYRPIVPKPSTGTSLPVLALPGSQTITAGVGKVQLGQQQQPPPSGGGSINNVSATVQGINVGNTTGGGPALIVQPVPVPPTAAATQTVTLHQQPQLQTPSSASFVPLKPGSVHQHVLPPGTTIKKTPSGTTEQLLTPVAAASVNTVVPSVAATVVGSSSVIVPKVVQINAPPAAAGMITTSTTTTIPVIQQATADGSVSSSKVPPKPTVALVRPPLVSTPLIPALYVQPITSNIARPSVVAASPGSMKTPAALLSPVIDPVSEKVIGHRMITTTSGGAGQPGRFILTTAPAPKPNADAVVQDMQQQRIIKQKLTLPPVPKLAPFLTTAPSGVIKQVVVTTNSTPRLIAVTGGEKMHDAAATPESNISDKSTLKEPEQTADGGTSSSGRVSEEETLDVRMAELDDAKSDSQIKSRRNGEEEEVEEQEEQEEENANDSSKEMIEMLEEEEEEEHIEEEDDGKEEQTNEVEEMGGDEEEKEAYNAVDDDGGEIERLDSSIELNENEPESTSATLAEEEATPRDDGATEAEVNTLEVTPKKSDVVDKSGDSTATPNASRISPRMQKRSLSEQQPEHQPMQVRLFAKVGNNNGITTPAPPPPPSIGPSLQKVVLRKRSESAHVLFSSFNDELLYNKQQFRIKKGSTTFQDFATALKQHSLQVDAKVPGGGGTAVGASDAAGGEDRKLKRPPLKDATNEPADDGPVPPKAVAEKKKDTTAVIGAGVGGGGVGAAAGGGTQDNKLLMCDEKFDMVSSSSVGDAEETKQQQQQQQQQQHAHTRQMSRRLLDSIRHEGLQREFTNGSPVIKLDADELKAISLGYEVSMDRAGDGDDDFRAAVDHSHPKGGGKKKARMDENNVGFVVVDGHVRSHSTSSESSATVKQYAGGGRRSLPEANPATGGGPAKKSSRKSTTGGATALVGSGGHSRGGRQGSIRGSIPGGGAPSESSFSVTDEKDSKDGGGGGGGGGQGNSDTTTVSDHLRWHDGIGYLDGSRLHFDFNEFGVVQPITAEEYERHCSTDVYEPLMLPINQRPRHAKAKPNDGGGGRKRRKSSSNSRSNYYCCAACLAKGNAAEFATPDYCSIECLQIFGRSATLKYIQESTHALQNRPFPSVRGKRRAKNASEKQQPNEETTTAQQPSKKRSKRVAKEDETPPPEQSQQQSSTSSSVANRRTVTTPPSTATTTTTNDSSDEDSRSSLSLNSSAFVRRPHLQSLPPSSPLPPTGDDGTTAKEEGDGGSAPPPAPADDADDGLAAAAAAAADVGLPGDEFDWDKYLQHVKATAVPPELFGRHPFPVTPNKFQVGMKLEAIDPENCSLFCVCTVAEVRGYRLKLHFDGYQADYDFWVNADSLDIFPPGWCRSTNRVLQPPKSYTSDSGKPSSVFRWKNYLLQTGATVPDHRCFPHVNKPPNTRNDFAIGMMLEADDLKKSGKVCVATVADKMGDRILVHFDGWDERYDYWVNITSPYIHPVDWHLENNDKITPPPDWNKPFNWDKYIRCKRQRFGCIQGNPIVAAPKELFQTRTPVGFKPGQRLEVVDRKQQIRIRPATVVAIDEYELQVCFDGWPESYSVWIEDDSPNIHPVNWCARTNHPLEPPPNYLNAAEVCDGTCEIKFCMGRGNAKFPSKKFHDRPAECPYKRSNWMCEFRKTLRISHNQIQKQLTDVFSGVSLYNADKRAHVKAKGGVASSSVNPAKTDFPHHPTKAAGGEAGMAKKRSNSVAGGGDGMPSTKRVKKELGGGGQTSFASSADELKMEPSTKEQRVLRNATPPTTSESSRPGKESKGGRLSTTTRTSPTPTPTTTTTDTVGGAQEAIIRIAKPVIDGYGPRLLHSYEVWRRNSRFLDECTERDPAGGAFRMKNPLNWTTDETARYIEQLPGCDECASKIRLEEITGKSFLSFTQDDLVKYMGIKVGPAIKVYNRIIHLRQLVTKKFFQLS